MRVSDLEDAGIHGSHGTPGRHASDVDGILSRNILFHEGKRSKAILLTLVSGESGILTLHALAVEYAEFLRLSSIFDVVGTVLKDELARDILLGSIMGKAPFAVVLEGDPGVGSGDSTVIDSTGAGTRFVDDMNIVFKVPISDISAALGGIDTERSRTECSVEGP